MSSIDSSKANEECVGPQSEKAGKASGCDGCPNQKACADGEGRKEDPELAVIVQRLANVKRKVLVVSGKGGVGKSTMTAQLGFALAAQGLSVGLLDVDICGPSIPQMLGLRGHSVHQSASGWSPVYVTQAGLRGRRAGGDESGGDADMDDDDDDDVELGVMSIGFMLPSEDDAVIWRGPRKNGLIKQFLSDVEWGALDYLLIDTPPGTSDEHISLVQYLAKALGEADGALVISTPQEVSLLDVRKELSFCAKTKLRVLGVVENMAEYAAPLSALRFRDAAGLDATEAALAAMREKCPELLALSAVAEVFPRAQGGAEAMANAFGVPFLGRVPLDPSITRACESGTSYTAGVAASGGRSALAPIVERLRASEPGRSAPAVAASVPQIS
jgi:Mrp family chromosome partitioning ATPase